MKKKKKHEARALRAGGPPHVIERVNRRLSFGHVCFVYTHGMDVSLLGIYLTVV